MKTKLHNSLEKGAIAMLVAFGLALVAFGLAPPAFAQNTIIFTAETTTGTGEVLPVLTWSTSPAADDCIASGSWSGQKGSAGTETLLVITTSATYAIECQWTDSAVMLSWTAPTQNTDGSTLVDLAGYRIYFGLISGVPYDSMIEIPDATATTYVVEPLVAGTWFFAATAFNAQDIESDFSNETMKTITGVEGGSEAVSITVNAQPNPPGGLSAN